MNGDIVATNGRTMKGYTICFGKFYRSKFNVHVFLPIQLFRECLLIAFPQAAVECYLCVIAAPIGLINYYTAKGMKRTGRDAFSRRRYALIATTGIEPFTLLRVATICPN